MEKSGVKIQQSGHLGSTTLNKENQKTQN